MSVGKGLSIVSSGRLINLYVERGAKSKYCPCEGLFPGSVSVVQSQISYDGAAE